jgi:hypothetical protein
MPEIGHFSDMSRLYSLFGLRVGADAGLSKSTSYTRRFIVNQGDRSSLGQKPGSGASSHLALS